MRALGWERRPRTGFTGLLGLIPLLLSPVPCRSQIPPAGSDTGYGYVSLSEGGVTLVEAETGESVDVEGWEPVLAGDELLLSGGARAEVRLADRNLIRLDDRAEIAFLTLAGSPDRADRVTAVRLGRGSLLVDVPDGYLGDTPPAIETSNSYVELRGPGTYLVEAIGTERTLVVVRSGEARVRAGTAITNLGGGEEAAVEGYEQPRMRLAAARGLQPVERWGERLASADPVVTEVYVDESIRYAAAPLRSYGTWIDVRGTRAWRPHVKHGWRPYSRGRWRHTPTGLFWVSYEPWGWVPHHYGNWDLVPGFGWVWFPGRRFAPAWVFWYWGPKYVGWVPWGYYSNRWSRFDLSFAVYGRAGGLAFGFGDWCFTPIDRFGRRHQDRYVKSGRQLGREGERIARGIITTDTRRLTPGHWTSPDRVTRLLTLDDGGKEFELEDVGPFVTREADGRLPRGWKPPKTAAADGAARIDPVAPTRLAELTETDASSGREPGAIRVPKTREPTTRVPTTRERVTGDPVTREKPRQPATREPATREKARQEVGRRPSIDPVRTTRALEPTSEKRPARTLTRPQPTRPQKASPSAGSRTKAPARAKSTEAARRTRQVGSSAPRRAPAAKRPETRASPVRPTSRGKSAPKTKTKAKPH